MTSSADAIVVADRKRLISVRSLERSAEFLMERELLLPYRLEIRGAQIVGAVAELLDHGDDFRILDHLLAGVRQLLDDRRRRLLGSDEAAPEVVGDVDA